MPVMTGRSDSGSRFEVMASLKSLGAVSSILATLLSISFLLGESAALSTCRHSVRVPVMGLTTSKPPSSEQAGGFDGAHRRAHSLAHVTRRRLIKSTTAALIGAGTALAPALTRASAAEEPGVRSSTDPFTVVLAVQLDPETTGEIEVEVLPQWAPLAASRFRTLVESGFYDDGRFFRVLPGYLAQFGISSDPASNKEWIFCEKNCRALPDEPLAAKNKRGTLSFASSGKNSRQTQVFINLSNNDGPPNFLDAQGFVPFARVTKGMDEVVSKLNSEYGIKEAITGGMAGSVNQGKAAYYGKEYLVTLFPKLSYINKAKII